MGTNKMFMYRNQKIIHLYHSNQDRLGLLAGSKSMAGKDLKLPQPACRKLIFLRHVRLLDSTP